MVGQNNTPQADSRSSKSNNLFENIAQFANDQDLNQRREKITGLRSDQKNYWQSKVRQDEKTVLETCDGYLKAWAQEEEQVSKAFDFLTEKHTLLAEIKASKEEVLSFKAQVVADAENLAQKGEAMAKLWSAQEEHLLSGVVQTEQDEKTVLETCAGYLKAWAQEEEQVSKAFDFLTEKHTLLAEIKAYKDEISSFKMQVQLSVQAEQEVFPKLLKNEKINYSDLATYVEKLEGIAKKKRSLSYKKLLTNFEKLEHCIDFFGPLLEMLERMEDLKLSLSERVKILHEVKQELKIDDDSSGDPHPVWPRFFTSKMDKALGSVTSVLKENIREILTSEQDEKRVLALGNSALITALFKKSKKTNDFLEQLLLLSEITPEGRISINEQQLTDLTFQHIQDHAKVAGVDLEFKRTAGEKLYAFARAIANSILWILGCSLKETSNQDFETRKSAILTLWKDKKNDFENLKISPKRVLDEEKEMVSDDEEEISLTRGDSSVSSSRRSSISSSSC